MVGTILFVIIFAGLLGTGLYFFIQEAESWGPEGEAYSTAALNRLRADGIPHWSSWDKPTDAQLNIVERNILQLERVYANVPDRKYRYALAKWVNYTKRVIREKRAVNEVSRRLGKIS